MCIKFYIVANQWWEQEQIHNRCHCSWMMMIKETNCVRFASSLAMPTIDNNNNRKINSIENYIVFFFFLSIFSRFFFLASRRFLHLMRLNWFWLCRCSLATPTPCVFSNSARTFWLVQTTIIMSIFVLFFFCSVQFACRMPIFICLKVEMKELNFLNGTATNTHTAGNRNVWQSTLFRMNFSAEFLFLGYVTDKDL